jgi:putative transposase
MLDRADKALSIRRQCALLGVARSGLYRAGKPANDNDTALKRIRRVVGEKLAARLALRLSVLRWVGS